MKLLLVTAKDTMFWETYLVISNSGNNEFFLCVNLSKYVEHLHYENCNQVRRSPYVIVCWVCEISDHHFYLAKLESWYINVLDYANTKIFFCFSVSNIVVWNIVDCKWSGEAGKPWRRKKKLSLTFYLDKVSND